MQTPSCRAEGSRVMAGVGMERCFCRACCAPLWLSLHSLCRAPCSLLQLLCCPQPGRMHKQQTLTVSFSPFPRWRQPPWITHTHSLKHSELSLSFYHSIYFTVWGPTSRVKISAQNQCLEPYIWKNNKENSGLKQTNKQNPFLLHTIL